MTDNGIVGAAVVGLGVGEQHALALRDDHRATLRWLVDLDEQKAQDVRNRIGIGQTSNSLEPVLADPKVSLVVIASYDDAHHHQVIKALEAGKHVFVEKPLCRTVTELTSIRKAWEDASCPVLMSNLVLRKAPLYRWLFDHVANGGLGRIYSVDGDYLYGRLHKLLEGWRGGVDDYSVIEGGGIHMIDLVLGLLGERPTSVRTVGNRICTEGSRFRYADFMAATYQFPSGAIARVTANFGSVHRHQHVLRVFGSSGTFIFDDQGPRVYRERDPGAPKENIELSGKPSHKGALISDVLEAILCQQNRRSIAFREFDLVSVCAASTTAFYSGAQLEIEYV